MNVKKDTHMKHTLSTLFSFFPMFKFFKCGNEYFPFYFVSRFQRLSENTQYDVYRNNNNNK